MRFWLVATAVLVAAALGAPSSASAAACAYQGPGNDWHSAANWSCMKVPDTNDSVTIGASFSVSVTAAASAGSLSIAHTATITFTNSPTLALTGAMSSTGGTIAGAGTVTAGGAFTKTTANTFTLQDTASVVLNGAGSLSEGSICLHSAGGGTPSLVLNGAFTIAETAPQLVFNCGVAQGPRVRIGSTGSLTKVGAGVKQSFTEIDNDGTLTVSAGRFDLVAGGGSATNDGDYVVNSGARMELSGANSLSATGRLGGAGTVALVPGTPSVTMASGATLDPAVLELGGTLTLNGNSALTLPDVRMVSSFGVIDSDRPLTTTALSVEGGRISDTSVVTVPNGGSFSKTSGGTLTLDASATLTVTPNAALAAGSICISSVGDGDPSLVLNGTFTIAEDASQTAFGCGVAAGPRVRIGSTGSLVNAGTGLTQSFTEIDNDGTVTVEQGTFDMLAGGGTATSDGDYIVNSGARLQLSGANSLSATGRLGGAGTVALVPGTPSVTLASGATLDPAVLELGGTLTLNGNSAQTLPDLRMVSSFGVIDTDRPLSANALSVEGGRITGTSQVTVPNGGSFSKTTSGTLRLDSSATLTLNADASLTGGAICLSAESGGTPTLALNRTFTIGAGAEQNAFNCGVASGPRVLVNGPSGQLAKSGAGTTQSFTDIQVAGGTVTVANGQTFNALGAYSQSSGLTSVAAGAVLGASPTLTGGVLRGAGQIGGNVTNTSGSVQPGASPGILSVSGNYSQGAGATLAVELAGTAPGTGYDRLAVTGTASLEGTLAISATGGFDPATTDVFDVVTSGGALSGAFTSLTGATINGKTLSASFVAGPPGEASLSVSGPPPPPPAPVNSEPPSLPASGGVGDSIACDPGSWSGSPSFAFEWLRDGAPIGATGSSYVLTDADAGRSITCRVTATNAGGSASAVSGALVPTGLPVAPPPSPPQTIRGEQAFTEGTANDLYLACTKLDLLLVDVLPRGRKRILVSGAADLRLAGQTVEIFLGQRAPGVRVGSAVVQADGAFELTVKAPKGARARKAARYQARVGSTRSQRLRLERRMVATTLTRSGNTLRLSGVLLRPFAKPPAFIEVERYLTCRRREKVVVRKVRPRANGRFSVTIPLPDGVPAVLYRARTRAPTLGTGRIANVFTLPRAVDL